MHSLDANNQNVPAFLIKLWNLVEDANYDDLIAWSEAGDSFIIKNESIFAKNVLPQYFKHNNMTSFIRQLNIYGFRKRINYGKCGLNVDVNETEWSNPFFLRGQEYLLQLIKRKIPSTKSTEPSTAGIPAGFLQEISAIREKQESMNNVLMSMKKENDLLWRELSQLRQKHKAQEQIIHKVIQFLVSIVQSSKHNIGLQKKISRMLHDKPSDKIKISRLSRQLDILRKNTDLSLTVPQDKASSPIGPVIHEVTELDHDDISDVENSANPDEHNQSFDSSLAELSEVENNPSSSSPSSSQLEPHQLLNPLLSRKSGQLSQNKSNTEQVLGIPFGAVITDTAVPDVASNVSIPEETSSNNTMVDSVVISIPEDGTTITPSNSEMVILSPDVIAFSPSDVIVVNDNEDVATSIGNEVVLNTPNPLQEDCLNALCTVENQPAQLLEKTFEKPLGASSKNMCVSLSDKARSLPPPDEIPSNDLQLAVSQTSSSDSSNAKNVLSNHIISVEQDLDWLKNLDLDPSALLTFLDDDLANNSIANQLSTENEVLSADNNITGSELVQFSRIPELDFDNMENSFASFLSETDITLPDLNIKIEDEQENKNKQNSKPNLKREFGSCNNSKISENSLKVQPSPAKVPRSNLSRGRRKAK